MSTNRILILAVLLSITLCPVIQGSPWTDSETVKFGIHPKDSYTWPKYPYMLQHYKNRIGTYPDIAIWDDISDDKLSSWTIIMKQSSSKLLEWKEITSNLWFKCTSHKSGEIIHVAVTDSLINWVRGPDWIADSTAGYVFNVRLAQLPITGEGEIWDVRPQAWTDPPPAGTLVSEGDSLILVHLTRTTAVDTFMWAQEADSYSNDPILCRQLLLHFPHNRLLLHAMFMHYYAVQKCDSMHSYADRILNSWSRRLDTIYLDPDLVEQFGIDQGPGPSPLSEEVYRSIVEKVWDVCGDTTGLTQYAR
ncbi:hypothetical protein KQI63_13840 [bacterium]|nr:hypothetical protein [bacterium]